jgi:hypothetical protein
MKANSPPAPPAAATPPSGLYRASVVVHQHPQSHAHRKDEARTLGGLLAGSEEGAPERGGRADDDLEDGPGRRLRASAQPHARTKPHRPYGP